MKKTLIALSLALSLPTMAQELSQEEDFQRVKDNIKQNASEQIASAPIDVVYDLGEYGFDGFYEINIGGQAMIAHEDGQYVFLGDFFDLSSMRNFTQERAQAAMSEKAKEVVESLPEEELVHFPVNEGVEKIGTMYVFSDTTCGYCVKLHGERAQYAEGGVELVYVPYPRSGLQGKGYNEWTKAMCSEDQEQAVTDFKAGTAGIKYNDVNVTESCEQIVANGYQAGQEIGVTGTPFIYLSNGQTVPGYNPANSIIQRFQSDQ